MELLTLPPFGGPSDASAGQRLHEAEDEGMMLAQRLKLVSVGSDESGKTAEPLPSEDEESSCDIIEHRM